MPGKQVSKIDGSFEIPETEQTVTESRKASGVEEEFTAKKSRSRCAVEKKVAWKAFKSAIFLVCLTFLIVQSVEFFNIYYKYPTYIVLKTTLNKDFKLPAVTFCFRNTISYKQFCFYEPKWCEKPRNMDKFCKEYQSLCYGDVSNLTIPNQDPYTLSLINRVMEPYFFNDSYNDEGLFYSYNYTSKTRTFLDTDNFGYLKCYSENLHLYQSRLKPQTWKIDLNSQNGNLVATYSLSQRHTELFYPLGEPQVFLGIHSPYVPIDPWELKALIPGKRYKIDVELEKEEHLLPPPYDTDCRPNGPSEDAEEFTNPNSFQMCLEMCKSKPFETLFGCYYDMTMLPSVEDRCFTRYKLTKMTNKDMDEIWEKRLACMQNCKQGCLKLQYKYRIRETDDKVLASDFRSSDIKIHAKNPEVTVLRHVPLYGNGEIFSHVGGLMGCWLGISVFICLDFAENLFWLIVASKRRFRREKEEKKHGLP